MQKIALILFVLMLGAAIIGLVTLNYFTKGSLSSKEENPVVTSEISSTATVLNNSRLSIEPERQIQALFVKTEGSLMHYIDKSSPTENSAKISLEEKTMYICRSPVDGEAITLDRAEPGYISFLTPKELDNELKSLEPILIVTIINRDGDEEVNYVMSAKCISPE